MKNNTPSTAANGLSKDLIHLDVPRVASTPSNPFFKRKATFKETPSQLQQHNAGEEANPDELDSHSMNMADSVRARQKQEELQQGPYWEQSLKKLKKVKELKDQIENIQGIFEKTKTQLDDFKLVIQYKERKFKIKRDQNKEFSQTLGENFYERQQNAHKKILLRWKQYEVENGGSPLKIRSRSPCKEDSRLLINKDISPLTCDQQNAIAQDSQTLGLINLQVKARRAIENAEQNLKEKADTLIEATDCIIRVIELLIHEIDEQLSQSSSRTTYELKFFNDRKYSLLKVLQHLKARNFSNLFSILETVNQEYQNVQNFYQYIKFTELNADMNTLGQLHFHLQTKANESYQQVLKLKVQGLIVKYQAIAYRIETGVTTTATPLTPSIPKLIDYNQRRFSNKPSNKVIKRSKSPTDNKRPASRDWNYSTILLSKNNNNINPNTLNSSDSLHKQQFQSNTKTQMGRIRPSNTSSGSRIRLPTSLIKNNIDFSAISLAVDAQITQYSDQQLFSQEITVSNGEPEQQQQPLQIVQVRRKLRNQYKYQTPKILELLKQGEQSRQTQQHKSNSKQTLSEYEIESKQARQRKYSSVIKNKVEAKKKDTGQQDFAVAIAKDMRSNSTLCGGGRRNFRISNTTAIDKILKNPYFQNFYEQLSQKKQVTPQKRVSYSPTVYKDKNDTSSLIISNFNIQ